MGSQIFRQGLLAPFLFLIVFASPAHALFKFNEGRDQIFITTTFSVGYDSNIFSTSSQTGDVVYNSSVALEYTRKAGLIGVNSNITWTFGKFGTNAQSDFSNPSFYLEFTKDSGRTTGSATFAAARESRSDSAAGLRTDSWNYDVGLNWKYPVIERYSLAGGLNYGIIDYTENNTGLIDLNTYAANLDLFYAYTSQRDLILGYRYRISDTGDGVGTTGNNQTIDQAITAGVSGKIAAKLNGTLRVGYQIREDRRSDETFTGITSTASVTWKFNQRLGLTTTLNKDFNTTSIGTNIDSTSVNFSLNYAVNAKLALYAGLGLGYSKFLDGKALDQDRRDHYWTPSVGVSYIFNNRLKSALTYSYFQNYSTRDSANYSRHSVSLNLSVRF
jgi:hypothetical protein